MRRGAALLLALAALAGCGGGEDDDPPAASTGATQFSRGEAVWAEQGCGSCHTFARTRASGPIGPNLDQALRGKSREEIRRDILVPGPYGMPEDFGERMSPAELDALVEFLEEGVSP